MVEGINMTSVYGLPIIYQKFGERKTTGLVFMIYQLFTQLKILFDMYLFVLVGGWGGGGLGVAFTRLVTFWITEVKIFFHNCCSICIFNLFMYIYLLVLVKSEYKHTEKSYRSFYQYWTQSELDRIGSLSSILNKWIRMGLFFPLLVQIIRRKSQLAVFIRIHFQTLQFWYALRLSSAKVGSSTIYTT